MDRLLQAVLAGELPVSQVAKFVEVQQDEAPLGDLQSKICNICQTEVFDISEFSSTVLDFVRDQAEIILSAAEKRTAASRAGTPLPKGNIEIPPLVDGDITEHRKARSRLDESQRLESVARRLQPGIVDDANFPALGATSQTPSTRSTIETCPSHKVPSPIRARMKPAPAVAPAHAKRLSSAGSGVPLSGGNAGGEGSGGSTPRRRIVPTAVFKVEVSDSFVSAPVSASRPGKLHNRPRHQ